MSRKSEKRPTNKQVSKGRRATSKNGTATEKVGWFFASNDGGEDKGLNDAGVVTFKGNIYRYLAREIIQNSLDARHSAGKPVVVNFQLRDTNLSDIPGMSELKAICQRCRAFWPRDPEKSFFEKAINLCSKDTISSLWISDLNTKGVEGDDNDRLQNRGWYSLIRCSGSSSKEGGEGGSYGIGKNAPFAASYLRTVLYSTRTSRNDVAFQGVARLVTHENAPGKKSQNIGFLGGSKGLSIRRAEDIPYEFQREHRGTDVVILGFISGRDWATQLRLSVLENFWPAIHFGDLQVQIEDLVINRGNLAKLLEESQRDDISAHYYYEAFTSEQSVHDSSIIPNLGPVDLYLHTGKAEMPKRVAMVRKSGMVIYYKMFRAAVPYSGVFLCRNEAGNALLRAMEPPRHDVWDADFPEKGDNKHVEKEFVDYIKDRIRKLTIKDDSKLITVPELSRFLPDYENDASDDTGGPEQAHENRMDGFPDKAKTPIEKKEIPVAKMPKPNPVASNKTGGETKGVKKGMNPEKNEKTVVPIRFRVFPKSLDFSKYSVTVRSGSDEPKKVMLTLQIVGDDTREVVRLAEVRRAGDKPVSHSGGKVGPVMLAPNKPLLLDLTLKDPRKAAMEVVAHEA